jgi:predicted DNA-binding mobile mystery protein A
VAELPPRGWVHTIRTALGMSAEALAFRMNVSKRAVQSLEAGEISGSAQLATLRNAAEAMDCDLVHVLVPRQSLDSFIERHAYDLAIRTLGGFDLTNTTRLETITDHDLATMIAELREHPRRIWRE